MRISLVLLMAVSAVLFSGAAMASITFETEAEMRQAFPEYFYFEFDLPEMELYRAGAISNDPITVGCNMRPNPDITYTVFSVAYTYKNVVTDNQGATFGENAGFEIAWEGGASEDPTNYLGEWDESKLVCVEIIDKIDCCIYFSERLGTEDSSVTLCFVLEERSYSISFYDKISDAQIQEYTEYVLSVVTPAIEGRRKG